MPTCQSPFHLLKKVQHADKEKSAFPAAGRAQHPQSPSCSTPAVSLQWHQGTQQTGGVQTHRRCSHQDRWTWPISSLCLVQSCLGTPCREGKTHSREMLSLLRCCFVAEPCGAVTRRAVSGVKVSPAGRALLLAALRQQRAPQDLHGLSTSMKYFHLLEGPVSIPALGHIHTGNLPRASASWHRPLQAAATAQGTATGYGASPSQETAAHGAAGCLWAGGTAPWGAEEPPCLVSNIPAPCTPDSPTSLLLNPTKHQCHQD